MKMNKFAAAVIGGAVAASAASVTAFAEGEYTAFVMAASADWSWGGGCWEPGVGTDTVITGDGTYTASVNSEQVGAAGPGTGFVVFNVDIVGLADAIGAGTANADVSTSAEKMAIAKDAGLTISDVSIILDGETAYTYADEELLYGDIEGNGNIRLELFNMYGETATTAPGQVSVLAESAEYDEVSVQFTISGLGGGAAAETVEETTEEAVEEAVAEPVEEAAEETAEEAPASDDVTTPVATGNASAAAIAAIAAVAGTAALLSRKRK